MRRRFNYTGRRRIKRSDVTFSVTEEESGVHRIYADLNLEPYQFPEDSRVYLEAYDRNAVMRFPYGTPASPAPEADVRLSSFKGSDSYHLRVKVVDGERKGRLLGIADSISPVRQEEQGGPTALLRLTKRDLGFLPWKLEFPDTDFPLLVINNGIDAGKSLARANAFFQATVFPWVVEQVLRKILFEDEYRPGPDAEPEDAWKEAWLEFGGTLPGNSRLEADSDTSEDHLETWIEDAVNAFCRSFQPVRKLKAELREVD